MNKEIVIPVSELKEALPGLSKIVSKKSTLPVLQSVRVARDAEGKVSLMGTDLDAFATYTVKEPQSGPADGIPPAPGSTDQDRQGHEIRGHHYPDPRRQRESEAVVFHRGQPGEAERQQPAGQRVPASAQDQSATHAAGTWVWFGAAAGPRMLQ